MFHASKADVASIFGSGVSEGQLDFDFPTKVYVEYMRIYPYCGSRHLRLSIFPGIQKGMKIRFWSSFYLLRPYKFSECHFSMV